MLSILKRNDFLAILFLCIVSILFRLKFILHPPLLEKVEGFQTAFLFQWNGLIRFYQAHPSLYIGLSLIPFLLLAFYLNSLLAKEKFFTKKSFIPAFAFILYTSFIPSWSLFSTQFVANFFILLAFDTVIGSYNETASQKKIFNAGLYIAIATIFYFPAIFFTLLFFILLATIRTIKLKEIILLMLGILSPLYIAFSMLYIFGKKINLNYQIQLPIKIIPTNVFLPLAIISTFILVYGLFLVNQSQGKNTNAVRKKWSAVGLYFVFASIIGSMSYYFPSTNWIMAITPFCIVLSQSFQNHKEKFNIFTLYFLLISLIAIQWFLIT